MHNLKIIDTLELFPATELEAQLCELPSGEMVVIFEDCTGGSPEIPVWGLYMAQDWLRKKNLPPFVFKKLIEIP